MVPSFCDVWSREFETARITAEKGHRGHVRRRGCSTEVSRIGGNDSRPLFRSAPGARTAPKMRDSTHAQGNSFERAGLVTHVARSARGVDSTASVQQFQRRGVNSRRSPEFFCAAVRLLRADIVRMPLSLCESARMRRILRDSATHRSEIELAPQPVQIIRPRTEVLRLVQQHRISVDRVLPVERDPHVAVEVPVKAEVDD